MPKKLLKNQLQKIVKDSDFREIIRKGTSYLGIRAIGIVLSYSISVFIARSFNSSVLGLYSICISIFMIISTFGTLGLDLNTVKFYSTASYKNNRRLFFRIILKSFLLSSFLSFIVFLLREFIAIEFFEIPKPELINYLNWVLLSIPFWSITLICSGIFRAKKKIFTFTFLSQTSRYFFIFLILIGLSFLSKSPIIIVKAHFLGIFITSLIALILVILKLENGNEKTLINSWGFVRESIPMMLSSSILILLGWIDTFILGIFETESNVGIYNVCLKIATFSTLTLLAINSILAPKIAKSYKEDKDEHYKRLIQFSTKINFYLSSFVILLILVFNKLLLGIFGDEYLIGTIILVLLCLGQIVNSFSGSVGIILQMIGKQKVYQNFILIALFINIIFNLILTPKFGSKGTAIATIISMMFWNIGSAIYLKKTQGIISYYLPFKLTKVKNER